ncbi:hypothetical protein C2S53_014010 [Perilla frutescens var. hirtella]|uniref:Uncharacterized protein n=1 Tax=Perilla frutescens var. hirtella TaxID=608512 RepID=A0AAD4P3J1_PERFH|nr:hypothetical protein C2S53_014010 [Perilla frutescens var. hirtella]
MQVYVYIGGSHTGDKSARKTQKKDIIVAGKRSAPESSDVAREIRTKRANDAHPTNAEESGPSAAGAASNATIKKRRSEYSNLKNRTSPGALTDAIKLMNDAQRQSVREMGFGDLLHLDISDVPLKIAYWILDNFDVKRGEIVFEGDRRVHVNENDVRLIFGFPKGPRPIVKKARNAKASLLEVWLGRFEDKHCKRIRE